MPYGRGGAGNYEAAAAAAKAQPATRDVEAQPQAATAQAVQSSAQEPSQYAHTGRGGAGNYYSPKELQEKGNFVTDSETRPKIGLQAGSSTISTGRGGAGNLEYGGAQQTLQRQDIELQEGVRSGDVRKLIAESVNESLARPPKARLSGQEP